MQIQISWLLKKPTDLDLHCLQRQDISGFNRTRVNVNFENTSVQWKELLADNDFLSSIRLTFFFSGSYAGCYSSSFLLSQLL